MAVFLPPVFKACGLEVKPATFANWPRPQSAWIVKAHVDIDQKGDIEHVFLEKPSDLDDANQAVVAAVRLSHVLRPGRACSGSLTVSWPGY